MSCLDFFIAGAQKSGTSALAAYLSLHPDIFLPAKKETHLFKPPVSPLRPALPGAHQLASLYAGALDHQACGDATPAYLYWPWSLELIHAHNQRARIILSLRHPALRAFSHWAMEKLRGREPLGFGAAIREGRERVTGAPGGVHKVFSYVERGFYARQLGRLYGIFPADQVHILRADRISAQSGALHDIIAFLGLRAHDFQPLTQRLGPNGFSPSPADLDDLLYLQDLFHEDMTRLVTGFGLPVEDWLNPDCLVREVSICHNERPYAPPR